MNYEEVQRFSPFVLLSVAGFILVVAVIVGITVSGSGKFEVLAGALIPIALIAVLYFSLHLRTYVEHRIISVRLWPFGGQKVPMEQVKSVSIVKYRPLADFGGWGVRYGTQGKIFSARGNQAVRLDLADGSTLLIGTQSASKLAAALQK